MEKIIKNTIEDFTDDQEIIEIEKLMLDKKYDEASLKLRTYKQNYTNEFVQLSEHEQKKEQYKFCIITIMYIICSQYINLKFAIDMLMHIIFKGEWGNPEIHSFIYDILQKTENGYYEKQQIETLKKECSKNNTTLEEMKNRAKYETEKVLKNRNTNHTPSRDELIIKYLFDKFQK